MALKKSRKINVNGLIYEWKVNYCYAEHVLTVRTPDGTTYQKMQEGAILPSDVRRWIESNFSKLC